MENKIFFGKKRPHEQMQVGRGGPAINGKMYGGGNGAPMTAPFDRGSQAARAHGMEAAMSKSDVPLTPQMEQQLLTRTEEQKMITREDVAHAISILDKYRQGKANLEKQIIENERWWKLRHWEVIRKKNDKNAPSPEPTSAWLFNAIINKHADLMDNIPEPVVLPRERSDTDSAKTLSQILPVVLKYNDFEETYADNAWKKLKQGTAVYGIFWDSSKDGGVGDISIQPIDLLKIYWEPGITKIQKSRNLFIVDLVDTDLLDRQYPDMAGKFKGNAINVAHYRYDENIDTSNKTVVVDWYYKSAAPGGRQIVHYVKFAGGEVLYASENDPTYRDRGYYDHGEYPVVFDVLFPEEGTPAGFGYVSICKDPQTYIDKLSGNILETSMMNTKRRFFASKSTNINVDQFLDWNEPIVEVEGEISDTRIKEISARELSGIYPNIVQMKIEEMKDTAANRDVNSGGTGGGVTAASAIAALQEAGNKVSRDIISASYRVHIKISAMTIELMRQFYDESRSFRITNRQVMPDQAMMGAAMPGGMLGGMSQGAMAQNTDPMQQGTPMQASPEYQFVDFSGNDIREQQVGVDGEGHPLFRKPIFDLEIKAQKKNPFSIMSQNELAKELLGMGAFNPERAQEIQGALMLMEFEGKEDVEEYVKQGQTLMNMCQEQAQKIAQYEMMLAQLGLMPGAPSGQPGMPGGAPGGGTPGGLAPSSPITDGIMQASAPRAPYAEALAKRSVPSV